MAVISDLIARLGLDPRDFNKKLKGAQRRLAKTASKFKELGRTLTAGVTIPLAGIGILATKQFADFDDALRKSAAILTGAKGKMKELEEAAREVGRTSTFSATQAAEAFFFLASAGLNAEDAIKALGTVATFAEAGSFDLATATDLLTDAQSAMGLSVEDSTENLENLIRVSDVLVGANTLANASTRQFSEALTSGAAVAARNAGLELEETVGILAAYADQGIKGADASTKLRIALRDLVTKATNNSDAFKKLGINVFDSSGNILAMTKIISSLERRFEGMSLRQKRVELGLLGFTDKSVLALQALIGFSKQVAEGTEKLKQMGGISKEVADKNLASFSSQMKLLSSRIKDVLIVLGKEFATVIQNDIIPIVDEITMFIGGLVEKFSELDEGTRKAIFAAGAFAAVMGPLSIAVGSFFGVLGLLAPAILTTFAPIIAGGAIIVGLTILASKLLISADAADAFAGKMFGMSEAMRMATKAGITLEKQLEANQLIAFADKISLLQKKIDSLAVSMSSGDLNLDEFINARVQTEELAEAIRRVRKEQVALSKSFRGQETVEVGLDTGGGGGGILALFDTIKENIAGVRDLGVAGGMQLQESFSSALAKIAEDSAAIHGTIGDDISEFQEAANAAYNSWLKTGLDVTAQLASAAVGFLESFTSGFGDAISRIIVFQEDFAEVMMEFLTNLLGQVVSTLAQIVAQWLISTILQATIGTAGHVQRMAQSAQMVFMNAFAATAAIPIVGPALAKGVATASVATAIAGSAGAAAAGGAAGASTSSIALQSGGLVLDDGMAFLHSGEQVLSEEDVDRTVNIGGGGGPIDFRVMLDGRQIMRQILPHLAKEIRLRGV